MTHALAPESLGLAPGGLLLDLGCADGRGTIDLPGLGFRAIGVELDAALAAKLARRTSPVLQGVRADGRALPFADASFDGAVVIEVLEHVPTPERLLGDLRRVLRPGAIVCVAVPTSYSERIYACLHPRYLANAEHVNRFTREALKAMVAGAGFEIERVEVRNLGPAISWLLHSVLRDDADPTGVVLRHARLDVAVAGVLWALRRAPVLRRALAAVERRVGKSYYAYARSPS
ncbi:MAG: methyltransferase domain-containing protein [Acidimicrobiales bacterium]